MILIREASARLRKFLFSTTGGRDFTKDEIESLAKFVMSYANMWSDNRADGGVFVEVDELAFRFREDRHLVQSALNLLETDRRAQKTKLDGLWRLQVPMDPAPTEVSTCNEKD